MKDKTPTKPDDHDPFQASQEADWQNFRDHLTTTDKLGHRQWVYAKKPHGKWTQRRTWLSWLLIGIMFAGPFIKINGNPLLMMNIIERRFSILGQLFWPQDMVILAVAMLIFITGIIIFTTAFGRLWCGWTCPQTVMMEMVFRKLEYLIEGDSVEQRKLAAAPWTAGKLARKSFKLGIFFVLSFIIGNTLLAYIIGLDALIPIITDDPRQHVTGLVFMILFTLLFFAIFARFREQACTYICPYGRFQSAMLDENTMVVAYDHKRGEKRGRLQRDESLVRRIAGGHGDCIDCHQCVAVCPTGIDIRDGVQMECVHCTACIDACDTVMDKVGSPRGLIRYASLNSIEKGEAFCFTPRMKLYAVVLTGLIALFLTLVFTRSAVEAMFLRAPGSMFMQTTDGKIENLYLLKLVNKTMRDLPVELKLEDSDGQLEVMGEKNLLVPAGKLIETSVLIQLKPAALDGATKKLKVGVYSNGRRMQTVKTVFVGPRKSESEHEKENEHHDR
ncbi:MAG: cytochrome c oxidase accessory protein CcoG [Verrucomicrobia bacterium]|nr:cytochrome c oxidase accessory protein CcoG [Verrucomicrobiota bacterium]